MNIYLLKKSLHWWRYIYFFITLLITLIGIIFIYSASQSYTVFMGKGEWFYALKQSAGFLLGLVICLFCSLLPEKLLFKYSFYFFIFSLLLCIVPRIPFIGVTINGAHRWISLYFIYIQPVEILKPCFIIFLARIFSTLDNHINILLWSLFFILLSTSTVLLLQPDFGQTVLLSSVSFIMFFITYKRKKLFFYISLFFLLLTIFLAIIKPYRFARIMIFLNPWKDPLGKGFQIIQSLIAIVNGSYWGVGIGHSQQKINFLPMQHTDFIFSIICEEIGIMGGLLLYFSILSLVALLLYRSYYLKSLFAHYILLGFSILLFLQTIINIMVCTALLPTKGMGLPFISYGISSIVGFYIMTGIVLSVTSEDNN